MQDLVTIPEKTVGKTGRKQKPSLPSHIILPTNFAGKEETASKTLAWARKFFYHFTNQPERKSYEETLDSADRMYRASLTMDSSSAQYSATASNVPSTSFFRRVRALTTEEKAVILGGIDLPMRFEPMPGLSDQERIEAETVAENRNLCLAHVLDIDEFRSKMGEVILYLNKEQNVLLSTEWEYMTGLISERVPIEFDEEGVPLRYAIRSRAVPVKDKPCFMRHDLQYSWFDAKIDDMQKQRCIILQKQDGLEEIMQAGKDGMYLNTDKVNKSHMHVHDGDVEAAQKRADNSGWDYSEEPTGLFDRFEVWIRVPINEKGEWDEKGTIPSWHWATFIGRLDEDAVCVRLIANPYPDGENPFLLAHSHEDDRGAYHTGLAELLKPNYDEECTTINQMIDNKTRRNSKPTIIELGSMVTRNFVFDPNKPWIKRPGFASPQEIEIQDTTQTALGFLSWLDSDGNRAAGTDKPVMGEALGGRTTAGEAKFVSEQAMKPVLDKAYYEANQILPWVARRYIMLMEHFSDPRNPIYVSVNGRLKELVPSGFTGPYRVKVSSVQEFEKNTVRRLEENNAINVVSAPLMQLAPAVMKEVLKQFFKNRRFDGVDEWPWDGPSGEMDSIHVARSENESILLNGVFDMPKEGENHKTHLSQHEPYLSLYKTLPADQQNAANIRTMEMHVAMHTYMGQQQQGAAPQQAAGGVPGGEEPQPFGQAAQVQQAPVMSEGQPAGMEGEAMGDQLGGMMGAAGGVQ